MRSYSSQYVITNSGPPLKRPVITTEDDGTIINIKDTGGNLEETPNLEFHNGIIIPGFVNCHCHLELSHMKGSIERGLGLGCFIEHVINSRDLKKKSIISSAISSDKDMYNGGTVLCADVCNTPVTFSIKNKSRIKYINLLEVFGIDPEKAGRRMDEISDLAGIAERMNLPFSMVPHSVYSVSLSLFRLLSENLKRIR